MTHILPCKVSDTYGRTLSQQVTTEYGQIFLIAAETFDIKISFKKVQRERNVFDDCRNDPASVICLHIRS